MAVGSRSQWRGDKRKLTVLDTGFGDRVDREVVRPGDLSHGLGSGRVVYALRLGIVRCEVGMELAAAVVGMSPGGGLCV
jgi:hypothetical protein